MNIHEYQAKAIFKKYGIPVLPGIAIFNKTEIDDKIRDFKNESAYVIKAQIHAGGRGKSGGIKIAKNVNEAISYANEMHGKKLVTPQTGDEGKIVNRIYVESGCNIISEYYLTVVVNTSRSTITFIASQEGGMDIEEVSKIHPEKIITISIDQSDALQDFHCRALAFKINMQGNQIRQFRDIMQALYKMAIDTNATQIEINPLVLTQDNQLIALDAKMNFDDNALFKHPEILSLRDESEEDPLELKASKYGLSYIKMHGNIGCMVNGAGLAMATMDIIKLYGATPANFLDVGGGADTAKVTEAFKIILSDNSVKAILVNIFGGIMHCDIIANGIINAANQVKLKIPLVVRLAGTNIELGKELLLNSKINMDVVDNLSEAASSVIKAINH
ncbi:ADP-forming succinate--CoA ligase subunit beta [Rickettsia endosymbiont of Cardiosporidium cionae]|uniref:ADP-forming succinate--CoA ligase subunit beta n=1 Tax=Rickettsia endosymbiont of Cardiosporidium cionae TaxID=2777155 RepID=UPI001894F4AB|nr:ADP-forming succinate--CoA ligase subunit beta [Rickettsia endosymbiont of Cardiosporidium cionae]KAF8818944.1 ADP-forming succinate--CoA ligase subunit beta [Rickettsia endosymbiont of Cardiosporidium cionae]